MLLFLSVGIDIISSAVVLLPLLLLLQAIFHKGERVGRKCLVLLLALCLLGIFSVTGMPTAAYHPFDISLTLTPFAHFSGSSMQYILNVVLFMPFGFLAAVLWAPLRALWRAALCGLGVSLFIELAQCFTLRVTDVNDLLMNTLGAAVGCLLALSLVRKCAQPATPGANRKAFRDMALLLTIAFGVMYFMQPILSAPLWAMVV